MNKIHVSSEINPLKKVLIHTPGPELEKMTPETSLELLYDDILVLEAARREHRQLKGVLSKVSKPLEIQDLLKEILGDKKIRKNLIQELCKKLGAGEIVHDLESLDSAQLAEQLITGTQIKRNTFQRYLSPKQYALPPLPNLFFTRDSAMVINNRVFIGNMANNIRIAEAVIMSHLFHHHPELVCEDFLVDATKEKLPDATFEGGDILIIQEDTLLIGMSGRTSPAGIDYLIEEFKKNKKVKHIFVVILPKIRATIHLDMVFTMIDFDKAVVYPPLILAKNAVDVIHVNISRPDHPKLKRFPHLLEALRMVGINLEPVKCGGDEELFQQREQWQSGTNFLTIAPGKIIGYGMNHHTYDQLSNAGIPRVEAEEVLSGKIDLAGLEKYAVAISGNELSRGGGGCRCMTMPVLRE